MEPLSILVSLALLLSLLVNLRSWFGRGGGRIKLGDSWFDFNRRELDVILNRVMTPAEKQEMQEAVQRGDLAQAQAIIAAAALGYLQDKERYR